MESLGLRGKRFCVQAPGQNICKYEYKQGANPPFGRLLWSVFHRHILSWAAVDDKNR